MTGFAETKVSYPPLLKGKTSKCVKHRSHVSSRECGHIHWSVLMRIIGVFLGLFAVVSLASAVAVFSSAAAEFEAEVPSSEQVLIIDN